MRCSAAGDLSPVTETRSQGTFSGSLADPPGPGQFVSFEKSFAALHLQLLLQQLSSFRTVAAIAVHVDGAGGGGVVDEEDAGDHVLCPDCTCDGVMRNEVLNIFLALK